MADYFSILAIYNPYYCITEVPSFRQFHLKWQYPSLNSKQSHFTDINSLIYLTIQKIKNGFSATEIKWNSKIESKVNKNG